MKKIIILTFFIPFANRLYSQPKPHYIIDCVQISKIEYLIIVENDSDSDIFLPIKPQVQKSDDTLVVGRAFSYEHSSSKVFKYSINGIVFHTNTPLSSHIKPDTVTNESHDPMPNFAVPGPLFKLGPGKTHTFIVGNSSNEQPRKIAFRIFMENNGIENVNQIIVGEIIPVEILRE